MDFTTSSIPFLSNVTSVNNATLGRSYSDRIPSIVFLIVLGIIGPIGNSHALYIYAPRFWSQRRQAQGLQNPYLVFVLSLAILDTFTCVIMFPTDDVYLTTRFTILSESMCKLHRYLQYTIHISGCCHITLISIHCWRMICRPYSRQINGRVAIKLCIVLHTISALCCIPMTFVAGYSNGIIDGEEGPSCVIDDEKHDDSVALKIGMALLGIFGISCFITISATNVSVVITGYRKRGLIADNTDAKKVKAMKTAAILSVLTFCFLIAYVPYLVVAILRVSTTESGRYIRGPSAAARILAIEFPFLNNAINPIVYVLRDEEFRERLFQIYPCMGKCKKQNESNTFVELT